MLYGDDCTDYNKNAVIVQAVHDFIEESEIFFIFRIRYHM